MFNKTCILGLKIFNYFISKLINYSRVPSNKQNAAAKIRKITKANVSETFTNETLVAYSLFLRSLFQNYYLSVTWECINSATTTVTGSFWTWKWFKFQIFCVAVILSVPQLWHDCFLSTDDMEGAYGGHWQWVTNSCCFEVSQVYLDMARTHYLPV